MSPPRDFEAGLADLYRRVRAVWDAHEEHDLVVEGQEGRLLTPATTCPCCGERTRMFESRCKVDTYCDEVGDALRLEAEERIWGPVGAKSIEPRQPGPPDRGLGA